MLNTKEFRTQNVGRIRPPDRAEFRRGFTLAEALLAVMVLSIAVGAIMGPISASYSQTRTVTQTTTAISMAHQLLDEMLSRPLVDPSDLSTTPGPEANEPGRAAFDNIDDYHGYHDTTDSNAASAMKTATGQTLSWNSTDVYSRDVTVEYRATRDGPAAASGDYLVIKVTVTMPHNHKVSVQRMVCRYTRGT
jgi:Tfp pilus assembly protein PilV